jgi:predicted DNA-binding protein (MmcQ/YjbR family)
MALEGVVETKNFGTEWFRFKKKPFCVLHSPEERAVAFKLTLEEQGVFLQDPRFFKTPYSGHQGWVSLRLANEIDWEEIAELAKGSYRLVAAKPARKTSTKRKS